MKEIALQLAREKEGQQLNVLREYLQNYLLFLMQKSGMNRSLYFVGGTALRFLYRIRRYSEDLDYSAGEDWKPADLKTYMKRLENDLKKAGYSCTLKEKSSTAVQRLIIGFAGLLQPLGLSKREEQKLTIHLEIDLNPPAGWKGDKSIVDIYQPALISHYDLASLFAGKMHALLMRQYTKGRDIFDLFWYRTKHPELRPNFPMLNNAIQQTHPGYMEVTEKNWFELLTEKISSLDWKAVKNDLQPFLEMKDDILVLTPDNLESLLTCR